MKKLFRTKVLLLIAAQVYSLFALAHTNFAEKDTIKIDEVVVTGSPVKVNRNSIPMAVSVVNEAQIEASNESAILPVLNGRVPGLFVTERGVTGFGVATGAAGQITIRGIGGNPTTGVLMLIDGHPQFMGIMGHPLPDSYVTSDVERVEVIRGPASILYGSNAMGGVINIITKKQHQPGTHANARLSYGSYNTQKYMGSVGYRKNKLSLFVSANHDQTDGHRTHSDFKINNGYVKLSYDVNPHLSASTDFSLAKFKAADPGPDTINAAVGEEIDILRGYWAFTLLNEYDKASGAIKLFYNFGDHDITDGFHSNDHNYGANIYEAFQLFRGNTITAGIDYMNYGGMAENEFSGAEFADTTISEYGLYAFSQQELGQLILNAGIRYQHNSVYGNVWIPSLGFSYRLKPRLSWKGNVSKGFRSPTMRELFMWGPNPNLDPETIWNYETGLLHTFAANRMQAEVTLFAVNGDNLIVNAGTSGYLNTGEVKNKGVEMALRAEPTKQVSLAATYSYIHMKEPVFATPTHHLFLSAAYRFNKFQIMADFQYISKLDNDASTSIENLVSYSLLSAKASYRFNRNIKMYVSGKNLLDTDYAVNRYYPMPGTTVFGGIQIAF